MSSSNDQNRSLRNRRLFVFGVVVTICVLVVMGLRHLAPLNSREQSRLEVLESRFSANSPAYEGAAARISALGAERAGARWIAWSQSLVCVSDASSKRTCVDTDVEQQNDFGRLPLTDTVVRQAKDDGRVFFVSDVENPPVKYLMYDPEGRSAEEFAEARGFSWGSKVNNRWSSLGHITDDEKESAMWLD